MAAASQLDVVNLTTLIERTAGNPEVKIGLIDGPVAAKHPDLAIENIIELPVACVGAATRANSAAAAHGTFVGGILSARRGSAAPAICPGCTLLVRPIFLETASGEADMPSATPDELALAIVNCVEAGARVLNLSVAVAQPSPNRELKVEEALSYAAGRGVIVVAAAGNQGMVGSSAITRHPWVIPVAACDTGGKPLNLSNLGISIGRRGLSAPGDAVTSLGAAGDSITMSGTSAAAPFVTGTVALLFSAFRTASALDVRLAVTRTPGLRRTTIVPPVLNAWGAYQMMAQSM